MLRGDVCPIQESPMSLPLTDFRLLRDKCYIDGAWVGADKGESFKVTNPADGAILGVVPTMGAAQTQRAVAAAEAAFSGWAAMTAKARTALMRRWFELIVENSQDLALLITAEQGKPLAEARAEVAQSASYVEWFCEEGKRIYGDIIPTHVPGKRLIVLKQPVGVAACITPWNFPSSMITRKCAPAMAAGCPVVIKPAPETPLSALALAELAERAGIPKGVLNVVCGEAAEIGQVLTSSPTIRKLSFTGSTKIGKLLMRQCAGTVKKLSLELGGNAPFIVFDDADLDAAVAGAIASKYRNSGQTCICANRILIQDTVYDAFAEKLVAAVTALKVGPGMEDGTQQGPLINEAALVKIENLVADAVGKGAKVIAGGKRHALGGTFYEPTVLGDVGLHMACAQKEIFGPVAPLFRFSTEKEAVRIANNTEYGLAAYFYTRDIGRTWRVLEALEYGIVGVNEHAVVSEAAPFGGHKESGIGRESSKYGIEEFLETKSVCIGSID